MFGTGLGVAAGVCIGLAATRSSRASASARCSSLLSEAPPATPPDSQVDLGCLVELISSAIGAGASLPDSLRAAGHALGGATGESLMGVGQRLRLGAAWSEAWGTGDDFEILARSLRPAWEDGASPRAGLAAAREEALRERKARARIAAGRLGVRLVLPLGLCFLPAFVLIGLIPIVLSLGCQLFGN